MKKASLRITVCLVLFVVMLNFLSSVKTVGIRRPPCAFARCTGGNLNSRKRASAVMKRVLTKVRN